MKSINLLIEHQCPQCGAPAELGETDRLFRCDYCRVSSILMEHPFFRYLLPDRAPDGVDRIYFPYWRFKGMLFSCFSDGIQHRFLDASRQALASTCFPASVGLRSQAMTLRFVTPDARGWFVHPELPHERALDAVLARFNRDLPRPALHQTHVGESLSLIYAPFYVGSRIIDAVLNQPVSETLDASFSAHQFAGGPADARVGFIPALCPNCGWDLEGRRDARVLHCSNCASMWQSSTQGLVRVKVAHIPAQTDVDSVYLPFWRISARVNGIDLESFADLVEAANLPRVVQPEWHRQPYHFWGPAFKLRPQSFLRLTRQVTLSQPREGLVPDPPPGGTMHPVNLPAAESAQTLKLNLIGWLHPRQALESRLATIDIHPRSCLLVYLPFDVRHHDLVQPEFNIAVNRNQLTLSGNL